jgi:hypothetical protein
MRSRFVVGGGLVAAASGALLWGYAVTALAAPPGLDAENNTYWSRDLRWSAALAVFAILVALARGERRLTAYLGGGLAAWLAADLVVDRLDLSHPFLPAAGAVVAVVGAGIVVHRTAGREVGRRALLTVAAVCAASAPVVAFLESPTDSEPQLAPTRFAVALLLAGAALAGALVAAPDRSAARIAVAVAALAGMGVFFVAGTVAVALASGGALLVAVWALSRPWPGWPPVLGVGVATLLGYPVLVMTFLYLGIVFPLGSPLTALAGNAPVNSADTDMLYTLVGALTGLVFTGVARIDAALRPAPVLS